MWLILYAILTLNLWDGNAPTGNGYLPQDEQEYKDHYDHVATPTLTIYIPDSICGQAILGCPGGGYWDVWTGTEGHNLVEYFTEQGIVYGVLKYRLPNQHHQVPLEDAQQAMRLLRAKCEEIGVTRVGVMGFSAGGHLASTLATHYTHKAERPDFQVLFYPVITMDTAFTHMGSRINLLGDNPSEELETLYSNEKQVNRETPEAFIVASSDDGLVPVRNSIEYYNSLLANGVSATLHLYPTGGHGWCSHTWFAYREAWMWELAYWLKELRK